MTQQVYDVRVLIGSLRKGSFSRRLAVALGHLAPASLRLSELPLRPLSIYDQDDEAAPPEPWRAFRQEVKAADALLFVTPEYNRSVPSVLKNAIDVGSRPKGQAAFNGKPSAVISCSPGVLGGVCANQHLRQSLMCMDVPVMAGPEVYLGGVDKVIDEAGQVGVDSTRDLLALFMQRFAEWIARNARTGA
jgi:chromate reductase